MSKKLLFLFLLLGYFFAAFSQEISSPQIFLGYKLGDRFTPHYRVVEYFRYIAQASKNVKLVHYGVTNEGRPLVAMFIASDENIERLEEIRKNNLRLAGIETAATPAITNTPIIVWLSYNVHGNEPASGEAAMQVLFDMVDPANTHTKAWLKNMVVIIDPCLNPDGRERYINFYNSVKGVTPDANPTSREHSEPWPEGRTNHYYFDLNRDWAWQTQKETQARMDLFNQWLPQIHVDYHEQGYNAPYYFAPAAEPFHKDITKWQHDFQNVIGKNNAKYFDQRGWLYFTKQEYDLLYPSYGDTYPIYNGSIGMTYEQGGIGAGLAIVTRSGDTLTLADRIAHHHSTSISTLETASDYAKKLLNEFKMFYDNSRANPPGEYKTYVIKNDNNDKIATLTKLLDRNGIRYGFGLKNAIYGYNYITGKMEQYMAGSNDLIINAYQPKSVLLNVLFEPKTFVTDSNTYDITAWSLPYAYGLITYGVTESFKPLSENLNIEKSAAPVNQHAYAYVSNWQSINDVKFLAALLKKGIKVKCSERSFEEGGKKFMAGSLLITRAGNDRPDFDQEVIVTATDVGIEVTRLTSGFVEKGADLGSVAIRFIHQPRVMLIAGDAVSAEEMGEIWHFFERQINYPVTLVRYQDANKARLSDFDVVIFPNGNYDDFPSDKLQNWVRDGGKLIAIQNAVAELVDKKGFIIKKKDDKTDSKNKLPSINLYQDRELEAIRSTVPGAIYKINLDNTHPLGFGLSKNYFTLKLSDDIYDFMGESGWNVGTVKNDAYVSGFVGQKSKEKIKDGLLLGVQSLGRGSVVYMVDDPLFRSFWENGKLLFSNAVFMVGQ
ncbi:MAG: zinc carboxypeptidase [Mucilaginibacter sp.]|nr:zinc carboxypeptidase [Mucilaginibacter sp.]